MNSILKQYFQDPLTQRTTRYEMDTPFVAPEIQKFQYDKEENEKNKQAELKKQRTQYISQEEYNQRKYNEFKDNQDRIAYEWQLMKEQPSEFARNMSLDDLILAQKEIQRAKQTNDVEGEFIAQRKFDQLEQQNIEDLENTRRQRKHDWEYISTFPEDQKRLYEAGVPDISYQLTDEERNQTIPKKKPTMNEVLWNNQYFGGKYHGGQWNF